MPVTREDLLNHTQLVFGYFESLLTKVMNKSQPVQTPSGRPSSSQTAPDDPGNDADVEDDFNQPKRRKSPKPRPDEQNDLAVSQKTTSMIAILYKYDS